MNDRIMVIGSSGLLGSNLVAHLRKGGCQVVTTYRSTLQETGSSEFVDLTRPDTAKNAIADVAPDVIVQAAALTNVDYCELNADEADKINAEGTRIVAEQAARMDSFLVYVSTDYVFDGRKGLYAEGDQPSPVNVYGKSKLSGERYLQAAGGRYAIVRPSVIFGSQPSSGKENFALWLLGKLTRQERVAVLTDQFVSPTLASSLAEMIGEVVNRKIEGVFHLSGAERVDRFSFAKRLAVAFSLDESLLVSVKMSEMKWVAKRPADSSLDVSKAMNVLSCKPIRVVEALQRLKTELQM